MRLSQSIVLLLLPLKVMACGLDWSEPVSHFENVDYQGNVHIVRKLGEVEKLPIYLIFNSSYGISPYAGSGFEIPLLESRMWQVDDNRFQMKTPSGWLWIFQRTKVANVLEGNAGWMGLIKDNMITVWAPCGDKISFKNGKIVSMQLKEEKFDYAYKGNRVESLQMNGLTILEVQSDDNSGNVTGIELPYSSEQISFQQKGSRPIIKTEKSISIVSRMAMTLGEISFTNGKKEFLEFGVDANLNPMLSFKDRNIVWSNSSKKIQSDGDWQYQVKWDEGHFAAIERSKGKVSEFWHNDQARGVETIKDSSGTLNKTFRFTSGNLSGMTRSITSESNGISRETYRGIYDDRGRLIREVTSGSEFIYSYTDNKMTVYKNGAPFKTVLSEDGNITSEAFASGIHKQYAYKAKSNNVRVTVTLPNGHIYYEEYTNNK